MYESSFLNAVAETLEREGGFVNDKHDPGGATNYGISLRFLRKTEPGLKWDLDFDGDVDADDIKLLTRSNALELYHTHFWEKIPEAVTGAHLKAKYFDCAVNMGPKQTAKLFQRALTSTSGTHTADDGVIGPKTIAIATKVLSNDRSNFAALFCLKSEQAGFYRSLIAAKPIFAKYKTGWLRRAYDL